MADVKARTPLNCIVDDSVLLDGLADAAAYDLRQWVREGKINLFVPLYALKVLKLPQEDGVFYQTPDSRATRSLIWLDSVTSTPDARMRGRVELQEPSDMFSTWKEVERHLRPNTALRSSWGNLEGTINSFNKRFVMGNGSRSNGEKGARSGPGVIGDRRRSAAPPSPQRNADEQQTIDVRELFNYVVWKTHNSVSSNGALGRYILLTSDTNMKDLAERFDVKVKSLEQLERVVSKNAGGKDASSEEEEDQPPSADVVDDDIDYVEEELVFTGQRNTQRFSNGAKILDPDSFGRSQDAAPIDTLPVTAPPFTPTSPRPAFHQPRSQEKKTTPGSPRGRGRSRPSRGANGRGAMIFQEVARPIDPDSYTRETVVVRGHGRGRAVPRKLFNPNT